MGMAASQARFLGLTARKTNLEYEGQQVNQQRTALSNQSANYYTQLLGMEVPVVPSVQDYTKTVYSFNDGALNNTITSLIANGNGGYKVSYLSSWVDDFSLVKAGDTTLVNAQPQAIATFALTPGTNYTFNVGANELRTLGEHITRSNIAIDANGRSNRLDETNTFTNANGERITVVPANYERICSVIGKEPQLADYSTQGLVVNFQQTQCYTGVNINDQYHIGHMEHNLCKLVWGDTQRSVTTSDGVTLTNNRAGTYSLTQAGWETDALDSTTLTLKERLQNLYPDTYQKLIDLYVDVAKYLSDHKYNSASYDIYSYTISDASYDHTEITPANLQTRWEAFWDEVANLSPQSIYDKAHQEWEAKYAEYDGKWLNAADYTDKYDMGDALFYDGQDPYLQTLSSDQLAKLYDEEKYWLDQLNQTVAQSDYGWYVRYVQNSATGAWEPIFYNGNELYEGIKTNNGDIYSSVTPYTIGAKQRQEEIKQVEAKVEQDSTGRYINITLYDANKAPRTYALTTNTVTDQAAYDDAMNQYEYDKYQYEQRIKEINAKIEITHAEDKKLELRLKQLDTEQSAIQTEMDAVSKVVDKNVQSTFKTFG